MSGKLTVAAIMPDGRIGLLEGGHPQGVRRVRAAGGEELPGEPRHGAAGMAGPRPGRLPRRARRPPPGPSATPTRASCWRQARG